MRSDSSTSTAGGLKEFLSTQQRNYDEVWCSRVEILPGYIDALERKGYSWNVYDDLVWGWRLFRRSRRFKAIITGSERVAFVFALLQKIRVRKVPHLMIQSMWNMPEQPLTRLIKRTLLRSVVQSVTQAVVYSRRQLVLYPREFGLPPEKLVFLHSPTCLGENFEGSCGNYIFSGGDSNRDYHTLIEAVRGLPITVKIVTRDSSLAKLQLPDNVEWIPGLPLADFNRLMAESALVAIALNGGKMETGGRSVYCNAMALGKPVVVADDDSTDYIRNSEDGIIVSPNDSRALREAIERVLGDRSLAACLAKRAKLRAESFDPRQFSLAVFELADAAARTAAKGRAEASREVRNVLG